MKTNALDASFRATTYQVETFDGVFGLRIGVMHPEFDKFLRLQGVSFWGVITAHNPGGVHLEGANAERQIRLLERIQESGWPHLPASNIADDGLWPDEPGYLLLHANEMDVCKLASEFDQSACVCGDTGAAPRLVWI